MSKHDKDCLRRKKNPQMQYICTCKLTDKQVHYPPVVSDKEKSK
jgi:hypothetical protein